MAFENNNSTETKKRLAMPDSVFIGCEQHAEECKKCAAMQESQKTILSCQMCEQPVFFCRSKPCEYKLHCINQDCVKSKHNFVFVGKNNINKTKKYYDQQLQK
ncbi:hypothetical protein M1771_04855 [Spiroplasma citri]|uniref:Uncharacterized protein n=1 Tax=Spiroplasma citri TaxID=2133 RepID=A0AAX3SVU1_SPICI|nr:hypothetical protein [Spiroplasma citri]WFG95432.1 hypothetical protein M0C40_04875 [Spiroplasma citri]WFG99322.1 hypothetical protein M1771_04855 [Spiroplasma citri]